MQRFDLCASWWSNRMPSATLIFIVWQSSVVWQSHAQNKPVIAIACHSWKFSAMVMRFGWKFSLLPRTICLRIELAQSHAARCGSDIFKNIFFSSCDGGYVHRLVHGCVQPAIGISSSSSVVEVNPHDAVSSRWRYFQSSSCLLGLPPT